MPWDDHIAPQDPVAPWDVSRGPRLGFQEALSASFEQQRRNNSVWGFAREFSLLDDEQEQKVKSEGKEYIPLYKQKITPTIDEMGQSHMTFPGPDVYKTIAKQLVDGVESPYGDEIAAHNRHIAKLKAENPGLLLRSMTEMYSDVKDAAHKAEHRASLPWTWGGTAGGLAGGMAGAVDPRTDPLNALSLLMGGGGPGGPLGRIAIQGVGQAVVEATGQLSAVQENRRLLGLPYVDPTGAIIGAAIGGAAFQGLGEVGVRVTTGKWFQHSAKDPAPPPPPPAGAVAPPGAPGAATGLPPPLPAPLQTAFTTAFPAPQGPLSRSRIGVARANIDIDHVAIALRPWAGPKPWEVPPPIETRMPGITPDPTGFRMDVERGSESVDTLMRRYDPDLFAAYDKLAAQKNELRAAVSEAEFKASAAASKETADLMGQVRDLRERMETATPRLIKKYQERINRLEEEVKQIYAAARSANPATWQVRSQLMYVDEQMRDMATSIARARNQSQKKWGNYQEQRAQIDHMIENGLPGIDNSPIPARPPPPEPNVPVVDLPEQFDVFVQKTGIRAVPELQSVNGAPKPGEAYVDAVKRINAEQEPNTKAALDNFATTLIKAAKGETVEAPAAAPAVTPRLKMAGPLPATAAAPPITPNTITMKSHGMDVAVHLDNDKIIIPQDDGSTRILSMRELAKEMEDDNNMLKAVNSCSLSTS